MKLISYAQSFEDVMLWRVFKDIEAGFYIDVGANDPVVDSVTKSLYDAGWNGINIEPIASHYQDLLIDRPRDINLCEAAGSSPGMLNMWDLGIRGWGTLDKDVADAHVASGHSANAYQVPVRTLASICEEHAKQDIHFLKIDVEGFERQVLEGMDFETYRPWLVLIEATKPNSRVESFEEWEELLLGHRYKVVYQDGLNRFYLSDEKQQLSPLFKYPPNVFDEFVSYREVELTQALSAAELAMQETSKMADALASQLQEARAEILDVTQQLAKLSAAYNKVLASRSWRLTQPLRDTVAALKAIFKNY